MPDYIGLGAFRCGTTSLATALRQHPNVLLWKYKEMHYWTKRHKSKTVWWYDGAFPQKENCVTGEITPTYLGRPEIAERIFDSYKWPDRSALSPKFLVLLRDPVQTFISAYWLRVEMGKKVIPLELLVRDCELGRRPRWISTRDYATLLDEWFGLFPRGQFWIAKSETLFKRPSEVLPSLWEFLGVPQMSVRRFPHKMHSERQEETCPMVMKRLEALFRPMQADLGELLGDEFQW